MLSRLSVVFLYPSSRPRASQLIVLPPGAGYKSLRSHRLSARYRAWRTGAPPGRNDVCVRALDFGELTTGLSRALLGTTTNGFVSSLRRRLTHRFKDGTSRQEPEKNARESKYTPGTPFRARHSG